GGAGDHDGHLAFGERDHPLDGDQRRPEDQHRVEAGRDQPPGSVAEPASLLLHHHFLALVEDLFLVLDVHGLSPRKGRNLIPLRLRSDRGPKRIGGGKGSSEIANPESDPYTRQSLKGAWTC